VAASSSADGFSLAAAAAAGHVGQMLVTVGAETARFEDVASGGTLRSRRSPPRTTPIAKRSSLPRPMASHGPNG